MIGRTQGHLAATACMLVFGACSDPEQRSDLRPAGPPEVLTVLVSNDAELHGIEEGATFCKPNDDKRPGLVPAHPNGPTQVCPDDLDEEVTEVTDAAPLGWYVRIQFDELLDPDIEELLPIPDSELLKGSLAKSQPVTIVCTPPGASTPVTIPYDGYYNPSGNYLTWPLGPSLFIEPINRATIPTASSCALTIKGDVAADKDGQNVPEAQRGPYRFTLAPMALVAEDPPPPKDPAMPTTISPKDPVVITFNAQVNVASLTAAEVVIREVSSCTDTGGVTRTARIVAHRTDPDDPDKVDKASIEIRDEDAPTGNAWQAPKTIAISFAAGAQVTQDIVGAGGTVVLPAAGDLTLCFKTEM